MNPGTGRVEPELFDMKFDAFYNIFSRDGMYNGDVVMDKMCDAMANGDDDISIELDMQKESIFFDGMILRLSQVFRRNEAGGLDEAGWYIHDFVYRDDVALNTRQHIFPPAKFRMKAVREKLQPAYKAISAQMSAFALQYEYFLLSVEQGKSQAKALELTDLEDPDHLVIAQSAHYLIMEQWRVDMRNTKTKR